MIKQHGYLRKTCTLMGLLVASFYFVNATPPGKELNITACGAVGDSITLNTTSIQQAIDKLFKAGGGTVVVSKGIYLTGALYLKQGVNLRIEADGVIKGSENVADYPAIDRRIEGHIEPHFCPALINAYGIKNLKITGAGTIQGGGQVFWDAFHIKRKADPKTKNLDVYRPQNLFLQDCEGAIVSGLKLRCSGFWNFHLYRCKNVNIENLDIQTPRGAPSTDGIDLDGCNHINIKGCYISVDDDCIALKGGKGQFADNDSLNNLPTEYINVSNCTFNLGNGAITLGSEATVVRHITMNNCKLTGPAHNTILKIKVRTDTPQTYDDIDISDIEMNGNFNIIGLAGWSQYKDNKGLPDPPHTVSNISIKNVTGTIAKFGDIKPPENTVLSNFSFSNIHVKPLSSSNPINIDGLKNFTVKDVTVE